MPARFLLIVLAFGLTTCDVLRDSDLYASSCEPLPVPLQVHTPTASEVKSPPIPTPLPTPSPQQLAWQEHELLLFVHFGINTFTGKEWGDGAESPTLFRPSNFNSRQWVQVAKDIGFGGLIFTAKHIDGFSLWPSRHTPHSVARSPWKHGTGDVVRDVTDACHETGLPCGLYLDTGLREAPECVRPW